MPSSTMWAKCNVGATKPEEHGLLFQFGRVDGYAYDDENHQFRTMEQNDQDTGDEYIPKTASGKIYNENDILDLADDAARVNMGGVWRMPTNDQLKELIDNTTYSSETLNGIQGTMFTSNINNKQLFIPFCGYWSEEDGGFMDAGSIGGVWSSQVHDSDVDYAYELDCSSIGNQYADSTRSYGCSVRGVFNK